MALRRFPSVLAILLFAVGFLLSACSSRTPTAPSESDESAALAITSQPRHQAVAPGATATLHVAASGPAGLAFQWYLGSSGDIGTPISGANTSSYTTPPLTSPSYYWVRVSAAGRTVDSTTATIAIANDGSAPSIVEQPEDDTIDAGQVTRLEVETGGPGPFTYQWFRRNGDTSQPIDGATQATYTTPPLSETARYWVRVSNPHASVDSVTVTVTVRTSSPPAPPDTPAPPAPPPPSPPAPPTPPVPPPAPLPPHPSATVFENEVLTLINERRAAGATCGGTPYAPVAPLVMNESLRAAARAHSQDMATLNYFSHTSQDGRSFTQRMFGAGYSGGGPYGENIAGGYGSAAAAVNGWMGSTGHCQNIMNGGFRVAGVGYAQRSGSTYGHYWTMNFGGS